MQQAVGQVKETVVAVLPATQSNGEKELSMSVTAIEFHAESIIIETDNDYKAAAEFGSSLKRKAAEVTAFFKPRKEAANKAHKEVCDREKAMLTPLRNAEKILKDTMGRYSILRSADALQLVEAYRDADDLPAE